MWPRRSILSSALATVAAYCLTPMVARAEDVTRQASAFVQHLADEVIKILQNKSFGKDDRVRELAKVFLEGFDVRAIGMFVLGVYARNAAENVRQEYLSVFKDYVVQTYAARFNSYAGETFAVTRATADGETGAWVFSDIAKSDEEPTEVQWRVRESADGYKIIDVVVEGVSLLITQRSEFAAVLQRNNGNVTALIALLRDKIGQLQKKS